MQVIVLCMWLSVETALQFRSMIESWENIDVVLYERKRLLETTVDWQSKISVIKA